MHHYIKSNLKESLTAVAVFICCFTSCYGQENFRKGYVVTAGRDTLSGLVDYREGFRSYRICQFKSLAEHDAVIYTPADILGYGLADGKSFETRKIKDANGVEKVVFLDVKLVGLVSLFKYERYLFVQKSGDSLIRISNDKSEKIINEKLVLRSSNQHVAVLSTMLFDCVELRDRTKNVPFVERNITTLLEDYNACKGAEHVTINAAKPWVKVLIGFTGGLHVSSLEVVSASVNHNYLAGKYETSKIPFVGISFDVLSPRISERLSFYGAVLYMRPTYRLDKGLRYSLSTHSNEVEIKTNQLKIPVGMRYSFRGENVVPYFNFGISTTINFASSSTWHQRIKYTTSVEENHYSGVWQMRTNQMGLWGGVGLVVSINRNLGAFMEIRYEETQSLSSYEAVATGVSSQVKNVQFIIGVRRK